jgi:hypothetical protein
MIFDPSRREARAANVVRRGRAGGTVIVGGLVFGCLLVAGCSAVSGTASSQTVPASATRPPATSATGATTPAGPAPDSPAIKSATFDSPDGLRRPNHYRLEVTGLRRRGPFTLLEGRFTCTGGPHDSCDGEFVLSRGAFDAPTLNTPAGITLIDPVGKKEYLVVRDDQGHPYTSALTPSMPANVAYPFYVNYPAVPGGVTSMTVVLPGGGQPQITDVPVS